MINHVLEWVNKPCLCGGLSVLIHVLLTFPRITIIPPTHLHLHPTPCAICLLPKIKIQQQTHQPPHHISLLQATLRAAPPQHLRVMELSHMSCSEVCHHPRLKDIPSHQGTAPPSPHSTVDCTRL